MESQKQNKGTWTSFGKLVVVGTVAAVCGFAAVFSGSQLGSSTNLLSLQTGYGTEVEQAYLEHLAKYGKQFGARSNNDIPNSFQNFAKNYEIVKKHNSKADRMFDMELNQFADMSTAELKNLKPEIDQHALGRPMEFPSMFVTQIQNSWDWSKSNKIAPV
jgi:hypothetical protein